MRSPQSRQVGVSSACTEVASPRADAVAQPLDQPAESVVRVRYRIEAGPIVPLRSGALSHRTKSTCGIGAGPRPSLKALLGLDDGEGPEGFGPAFDTSELDEIT